MTPPQQKIARLARGERSMFAVGVLVCLTLFGIAGLLFFSREYANQRQAEAETAAVTAALDAARAAFADETRAMAERLPEAMILARKAGTAPIRIAGATEAYVVDLARDLAPAAGGGDRADLLRAAAPLAAEPQTGGALLRGPLSERAAETSWAAPRSAIAMRGGRFALLALVPFLGAGGRTSRWSAPGRSTRPRLPRLRASPIPSASKYRSPAPRLRKWRARRLPPRPTEAPTFWSGARSALAKASSGASHGCSSPSPCSSPRSRWPARGA